MWLCTLVILDQHDSRARGQQQRLHILQQASDAYRRHGQPISLHVSATGHDEVGVVVVVGGGGGGSGSGVGLIGRMAEHWGGARGSFDAP